MARNIRLVEFKDEEVYPIEQSALGTNAYYCDYCGAAGYRPNYASCLRRIEDRKAGSLDTNEAACGAAIASGSACMVIGMRKEEEQAGRAIYYVNRKKLRENQIENAEAMGLKLGRQSNVGRTLASPKAVDESRLVPKGIAHAPEFKSTPTVADAINKRMRELAKEPTEEKTTSANASTSTANTVSSQNEKSAVTFDTTGMSLLEIAKRRKQQAVAN